MIKFENGRPVVIDGVEEINILCDIFKVPEEVRAEMVRKCELESADTATE